MAETAEQLVVSLEARIRDFEKNFQKASRAANDNWRSIERRGEQGAKKLESTFAQATKGVSNQFKLMATSAAGALTAALGVAQLKKYADEWTAARSKIAAAGEELGNVAARQSQLADLAIASRSDLGAVVDLYTGLKRSTADLGASQAQVLKVTGLISKAFAVSGASSETTAGAILQLNQALASGALRGDELNSVLEGAPPLARLIAKEFGVGVGQLKSLGEQGKLTADRVFSAILNGASTIEGEFSKTTPTIAQSVQILTTSLQRYVGEVDQATGVSGALSGAIQGLAGHMNVVAPLAATFAAGLAGFYTGGPIVAGISAATVALAGFGNQMHPIAGELASLANYARVAFDLVKDQGSEAAGWFSAQFGRAAALVSQALASIDAGDALAHLLSAVKATANLTIGAFVAAGHAIVGAWNATGAAIVNTIVGAMNAVISAVEGAANKVAQIVNSITAAANAGAGTAFPQIAPIQIGRIAGTYRTAGEIAGKAFADGAAALKQDYLGDIEDALNRLRDRANKAAIDRTFNHRAAPDDGDLNAPLKTAPGKSGSGAGKGGHKPKADHENDFQREIADLERRARAFDQEREAIGKEAIDAEKTKAAFELLEAAKKSNVEITPELQAKVNDLAGAYANAKVKLDEAKQAQEEWQSGVKAFGDDLKSAFSEALLNGERLDKVLDGLLKKMASRLFDKGFDGIFNALTGNGGAGMFGMLRGIFGFADGGYIRGPGTGRSDSIPAYISNGEYIVNARATSRHRGLLDAINSGRIPKFASGGIVGAPSISTPAFAAGKGAPINLTSNVTLNAAGGTDEQNRDLAKQTSRAVEQQIRAVVVSEIAAQLRPGNLLSAR
ncbi:tape measure protein [Methylocystis sp. S23]